MSGISATYLQWSPGNEYASKEEIPLDMIVYDAYGAEEEVWEQYGLILGIDEDKACHMGFMDEDQKLEFLEKTRKMTLLDMYDAMVNLVKATGEISRYQGIKDSEQARLEAWKYHDKVCEAYEIATRCIYYNDLKPKAAEGVNHDANGKPETEPFFLHLLNTDSPGTYKAIQKGIDSGRIRITPEGKLDFRFIKKGTLAHIFKTGGYTDWSRVKGNVLIDGQKITGNIKNLAAIEPPKDFEEIKKELYPN
jgi:hypothetical protein